MLLVVHRSIRFPICGAIVTGVFLRAHTMREERCVRVFVCVRVRKNMHRMEKSDDGATYIRYGEAG